MRDVGASSALAPGRFAPEAVLVRLPQWRMLPDGRGEILMEKAQHWAPIHPIFVRALEAIRDGAGFEESYQSALQHETPELKSNHIRLHLRKFYYTLHESGYIRIQFEEPPDTWNGRYARVRELGRGGVGIAHLARDEARNGAPVVVKHAWGYVHRIKDTDHTMRKEGEILRAFDHPSIVRFLGEFEIDGLYHLVREFGDGTPLIDRVRSGALGVTEARRVARLVAEGVQHVHERGYLMLDITPKNFVLRGDGTPQMIDAGICRPHVDGKSDRRSPAGSRGYAAPEVVGREGASLRSDVFGFGCLYHYLVGGRTPKHLADLPERMRALEEAGVAEADVEVVRACCGTDPEARAPDMSAVLALIPEAAW